MHLQAMEGMGDWGFREGDPLTESVDEETLMFFTVDHFVPPFKENRDIVQLLETYARLLFVYI
jgi:hypothetical protein